MNCELDGACRGVVKKLTTNPKKFQQGEIIGNIRCFIRSVGVLGYEDIPFRPAQSIAGTALVTQLNLKEQYLVVRYGAKALMLDMSASE